MAHKNSEDRKRQVERLHEAYRVENEGTRGRLRENKPWTEQEIALLWDANSLRAMKLLARSLDRSIEAVRSARYVFVSRRPQESTA